MPTDDWRPTIPVSEVPPGTAKSHRLPDGEAVVIANVNGRWHAMAATCSHAGWDLADGSLEGTRIVCAGHGASWDLTRGTAEFDEDLPPLPLYDVRERDGTILVRRRSTGGSAAAP
jgi:nitrite reductase/ring-hydroxylating ferredoxin subunit